MTGSEQISPEQPENNLSPRQFHTTLSPSRGSVFDIAEAEFVEVTEEDEKKSQILKEEGNKLFQQGNMEEAVQKYTEALKITPNNEKIFSNRAAAYISMEKYDLAIKDAEEAIEINPSFAKAFTRLGTALKGAGLFDRAKEAYVSVLKFLNEEDTDWSKIKNEIQNCLVLVAEQYQDKEAEVQGDLETMVPLEIDVKKDVGASTEEEESEGPPNIEFPEKYRPKITEWMYWEIMFTNPGNISNIIGFVIMIAGFAVWGSTGDKQNKTGYYLRSVGLYAFAGGITNWIAIQMLWNKIPHLQGTGIILEKYEEIRDALKETVMTTFFDETYLNWYVKDKLLKQNYVEITRKLVEEHNAHEIVLEVALKDPNMRALLGPGLKPLIMKTVKKMEPKLKDGIKKVNLVEQLSNVRNQIDKMLDGKLQIMTPLRVKALMEDLIASELYWLVVWGNIFGGGLGIISALVFKEAGVG